MMLGADQLRPHFSTSLRRTVTPPYIPAEAHYRISGPIVSIVSKGVARVNPIFTWVRLAQRIPVRIQIDKVPGGGVLVAGMTATVQIDARAEHPSN
jgi:multidrug resistance efflux pump